MMYLTFENVPYIVLRNINSSGFDPATKKYKATYIRSICWMVLDGKVVVRDISIKFNQAPGLEYIMWAKHFIDAGRDLIVWLDDSYVPAVVRYEDSRYALDSEATKRGLKAAKRCAQGEEKVAKSCAQGVMVEFGFTIETEKVEKVLDAFRCVLSENGVKCHSVKRARF